MAASMINSGISGNAGAALGAANFVAVCARIVSAYISKNVVNVAELPSLIGEVHDAIIELEEVSEIPVVIDTPPAIAPRKSVTPDFIICLEDGKKFKSLKRHLRTAYGLSPDEYREKWGLPPSYPMVAPKYSATRSQLAKHSGLGRKAPPPARRPRTKASA